jgi:phosphoribosylanthranilate isomerase
VRVDVKFCGLTRAVDAEQAIALGAAYVGVIFAGGPRMLTAERAREVLAAVPASVRRVGVFADQTASDIARIADRVGLHVAQLHGNSDVSRVKDVRRVFAGGVWPVVRVVDATLLETFTDLLGVADAVLLDAYSPSALGGTGTQLPWRSLAPALARRRGEIPIILAGGLSPENVGRAIDELEPNVVDVSSGVELSPGIKDHDRMRAFRDAVAQASISSSR